MLKLGQLAKLKQLEFHPDKTGFIILGRKENVIKIRKEIEQNPITCNGFQTKEKQQEKSLGVIFQKKK